VIYLKDNICLERSITHCFEPTFNLRDFNNIKIMSGLNIIPFSRRRMAKFLLRRPTWQRLGVKRMGTTFWVKHPYLRVFLTY